MLVLHLNHILKNLVLCFHPLNDAEAVEEGKQENK
jgi:hypothetical protein